MGSNNNHKPVTRAELKAELSGLATKEELKGLATKEDLKKLATKEELKKLATKEELKKLATREEFQRLAIRVIALEGRVERIEERMATKDDIQRIMTVLDGLVATYTSCWNKLTVHDQRIKELEAKVGA